MMRLCVFFPLLFSALFVLRHKRARSAHSRLITDEERKVRSGQGSKIESASSALGIKLNPRLPVRVHRHRIYESMIKLKVNFSPQLLATC